MINNNINGLSILSKNTITTHLINYLGDFAGCIHNEFENYFSFDIVYFLPTLERPYYTFITIGMSFLPMQVPKNSLESPYAELLVTLPATWQLSKANSKDMNSYWPLQLLIDVCKFPFQKKTYLSLFSRIDSEIDEFYTIAGTDYSAIVLLPSFTLPPSFSTLKVENKEINFYSIVPLYEDELSFLNFQGNYNFLEKFYKSNLNEIIIANRINFLN